jgi:hypothetical protein
MFLYKEIKMTAPAHEHELKETIKVDVFYPDHAQRKESALFAKTKHHLVHEKDTPCFICGTKEKREVHHFHLEWAYAEAVDWDKMKELHPTFEWSSFKEAKDFVDSEYNMLVLCEKHHRGEDHGIHMLPYPIWIAQKYLKKDFVFSA